MNSAQSASIIGIVDDNEEARQSISSLVRWAGYQTAAYESPDAFLNSPGRLRTNCLILSFQTIGLDGLNVQRLLSAVNHSIPIIGINILDEELRSRALKLGAFQVFGPPFRIPMVTIRPRDGAAQIVIPTPSADKASVKPFSDVALLIAIRSALKFSGRDPNQLE